MNDDTRKLRVLILTAGLAIGAQGGGAERFGIEIARHLDQTRFEPIVCAFWKRGLPSEADWYDYLVTSGVETFFAVARGQSFTPWSYVAGLRNIVTHLRGRPTDIIHSQFQLGTIGAIILRRMLGAGAILRTAHGVVEREWMNTPAGRLCRWLFTKWLFPLLLDAEVGVSKSVVASMNQRPGARARGHDAILIYNAIPIESQLQADARERARAVLGLGPSDLVIGSVGRLSEQKGYIYLLRALPTVLAKQPEIKIILIGDGELRHALEAEAASLGVAAAVTFAGPQPDVGRLYPALDHFVLPSLWEGLPTVIMEAMVSGIPVVATHVPGTVELVADGVTGTLVAPRDSAQLANAILTSIAYPEFARTMAMRAREFVLAHFDIRTIARQHEAMYRQLASPLKTTRDQSNQQR